jgi:hypothetical protein
MAGFDIRWNSPLGNLPYAIYSQMIGEDVSSYVPAKYLAQYGIEAWKPLADGGLVQSFLEYADTTCSDYTRRGPYYQCAYTQGRFDIEGYRYRGRVIGHATDADSESLALGASYSEPNGSVWTATARAARLNRPADARNALSKVPANYDALEFGWRGMWKGESLALDLGVESLEPANAKRDISPFGFISWHHDFKP